MKRSINYLIGLLALVLLSVSMGCGGGSGTGGGNTNTRLLDPALRQQVMTAVSTRLATLPTSADGARHNPDDIVTALKATSGISGIVKQTDGNVTGQFADGTSFTIINNVPADGDPNAPPDPIYTNEDRADSSVRSIPANGNVAMLDAFGDAFARPGTGDAAMFQANGYTVASNRATVAALRALSGKTMGVLFLSGHGGDTQRLPNAAGVSAGFGIWTATLYVPTAAEWAKYSGDVADGSLAFMLAPHNYVRNPAGIVQRNATGMPLVGQAWHYAIRPPFITKYKWTFASDSLVMLNACSGGTSSASAFRNALFAVKASVVAAWTDTELVAKGYQAASYLFDRMLGANTIAPLVAAGNPPRRAFSFTESKAAADLTQLTKYTATETVLAATYTYHPELVATQVDKAKPTDDRFTILKPAIISDGVMEGPHGTNPQLQLSGYFGVPGGANTTVTVGGSALTIASSDNTSLTAPISATASGPVIVQVKRDDGQTLTSNTRNLSAWSGTVTATVNGFGQTSGSIVTTGTFNVHFRADIQSAYAKPDDLMPTERQPTQTRLGKNIYPIGNSGADTLNVTGSGTSNDTTMDGSGKVTYSRTEVLSGSGNVMKDGFNNVALSLPPDPTQPAYFTLGLDTNNFLTIMETIIDSSQGGGPMTSTLMANLAFSSEYFIGYHGDVWVPMTIDANYNIKGATLMDGPGGTGTGDQHIMTYTDMPCSSPPVGNTARTLHKQRP